MSPQSHSYGTGSRPERVHTRLPALLLGIFLVTQLIFLFYWNTAEEPSLPTEATDNLVALFENPPNTAQRCTDACGLGLELSGLSEAQHRYWSLPAGVFVESVAENSHAYDVGLREGDILVSINDQPTPDLETARQLLASVTGDTIQLTYYRNQQTTTVTILLSL